MVQAALAPIRIVLVEPAGPLNVGSVARVMANMGLTQLVLVNPQCDYLGDEARRMAVHAADVLAAATAVPDLPTALADCHRAIATTARSRTLGPPLELPEAALPWLLSEAATPTALVFGPEDRGLSNQELAYAQRWVGIPSDAAYTSLNLAQAVAVCCYELARAATPRVATPTPITDTAPPANLPPRDQMEGFYGQLEQLLLSIGYLYPHTCASRMEKLRHFFNRAAPTEQELAMLRGILRQMDWARRQPPPKQQPLSPPSAPVTASDPTADFD